MNDGGTTHLGSLARLGDAVNLRFLFFTSLMLPVVGHNEAAVGACKASLQAVEVIVVRLHNFHAALLQALGLVALRVSDERAHSEGAILQSGFHHRAALRACGATDGQKPERGSSHLARGGDCVRALSPCKFTSGIRVSNAYFPASVWPSPAPTRRCRAPTTMPRSPSGARLRSATRPSLTPAPARACSWATGATRSWCCSCPGRSGGRPS